MLSLALACSFFAATKAGCHAGGTIQIGWLKWSAAPDKVAACLDDVCIAKENLSKKARMHLPGATVVVKLPVNADWHGVIGTCMFAMMPGSACSLIVWNDVARCEPARAGNGLGVRSQQTLSANLPTYGSHRKSTTSPPGMGSVNAIALLKRERRDLLVYHDEWPGEENYGVSSTGPFFLECKMKNDRKSKMVHFRCSESEKKILQDAAESIGLGESLFLRTSILKAAEELGHGRDQRQKSATIAR